MIKLSTDEDCRDAVADLVNPGAKQRKRIQYKRTKRHKTLEYSDGRAANRSAASGTFPMAAVFMRLNAYPLPGRSPAEWHGTQSQVRQRRPAQHVAGNMETEKMPLIWPRSSRCRALSHLAGPAQIPSQPVEHRAIPKPAVQRFYDPVIFTRNSSSRDGTSAML